MYDNNIKAHFVEYVERYVNVVWNKKDEIKATDEMRKRRLKSTPCASIHLS